jgi:hypothetical protein
MGAIIGSTFFSIWVVGSLIGLFWFFLVVLQKKRLLSSLATGKLPLPHFLRGLFDLRDWYGAENMAAVLLVGLHVSTAIIVGECLAMARVFNVD